MPTTSTGAIPTTSIFWTRASISEILESEAISREDVGTSEKSRFVGVSTALDAMIGPNMRANMKANFFIKYMWIKKYEYII
jgi:hypothetical protein